MHLDGMTATPTALRPNAQPVRRLRVAAWLAAACACGVSTPAMAAPPDAHAVAAARAASAPREAPDIAAAKATIRAMLAPDPASASHDDRTTAAEDALATIVSTRTPAATLALAELIGYGLDGEFGEDLDAAISERPDEMSRMLATLSAKAIRDRCVAEFEADGRDATHACRTLPQVETDIGDVKDMIAARRRGEPSER